MTVHKPYQRTLANAKAMRGIKKGSVVAARGSSAVWSKSCPEGRENNSKAKVAAVLDDCPGGVFLDRDLHGCRYWNAEDLKLVKE